MGAEMLDSTLIFINSSIKVMNDAANFIKEKYPKIYSQKLVEHLFYHFYTKNEYLCETLTISRKTGVNIYMNFRKRGF